MKALITWLSIATLLCACAAPQGDAGSQRTARTPKVSRNAKVRAEMQARATQESQQAARPTANFGELLREGDRLRDSGDTARAAWSYLKAMRASPDRSGPRERIAYLHLEKGDNDRAEVAFDDALRKNAGSVPALVGRGLALISRGAGKSG